MRVTLCGLVTTILFMLQPHPSQAQDDSPPKSILGQMLRDPKQAILETPVSADQTTSGSSVKKPQTRSLPKEELSLPPGGTQPFDGLAAFIRGREQFEFGKLKEAKKDLSQFIDRLPNTNGAAEATYRLAVILLLEENKKAADELFRKLVFDYFGSPWSALVMKHQFDEETLFKTAGELREAAIEGDVSKAHLALKTYAVFARRFPESDSREEMLFMVADCFRLIGARAQFHQGMIMLCDEHADSIWGKLAKLQLGEVATFLKLGDELLASGEINNEVARLYLRLSEQHRDQLSEEDKLKCRCNEGYCYQALSKSKQASNIFEEVRSSAPKSKAAAEATFWLADTRFRDGDYKRAIELFDEVCKAHPGHPRASEARELSICLKQRSETQKALERLLAKTIERLNQSKSFAFSLKGRKFLVKLALQDKQLFLRIQYDKAGFLFVINKTGTYYHSLRSRVAVAIANKLTVPVPQVHIEGDGWNRLQLNAGLRTPADGESVGRIFHITATLAHIIARRMTENTYLRKVEAVGNRTIFTMHSPAKSADQKMIFRFEFEGDKIRRIEAKTGSSLTGVAEDLRLGEHLPDSDFALPKLPDVILQKCDNFNMMEVVSQGMTLLATAVSSVQKDLPVNLAK